MTCYPLALFYGDIIVHPDTHIWVLFKVSLSTKEK